MKAKRWIALALAVCLCCLLAACGGKTGKNEDAEAAVRGCATMGEAFALAGKETELTGYGETAVVFAFELNGTYWRLTADLTPAQADEIDALDVTADDHIEKCRAITGPLAVTKCEKLDEKKLTDEQLQALAGKTGAELLDGGWRLGSYADAAKLEFELEREGLAYTVTFEAQSPIVDPENIDAEETIRALKVKSAAFRGLGDSAVDTPVEAVEDVTE